MNILPIREAGVSGYVTRDGSYDELLETIRSVANGELICTPRVAGMLLRRVTKAVWDAGPDFGRLTARERQTVRLIDRGLSNKEIACRLNIELSTVKNHVHHILEKSSTRRRGAAAAHLRREFMNGASVGPSEDSLPSIHADGSRKEGRDATRRPRHIIER